jgi:hypothetical protein
VWEVEGHPADAVPAVEPIERQDAVVSGMQEFVLLEIFCFFLGVPSCVSEACLASGSLLTYPTTGPVLRAISVGFVGAFIFATGSDFTFEAAEAAVALLVDAFFFATGSDFTIEAAEAAVALLVDAVFFATGSDFTFETAEAAVALLVDAFFFATGSDFTFEAAEVAVEALVDAFFFVTGSDFGFGTAAGGAAGFAIPPFHCGDDIHAVPILS